MSNLSKKSVAALLVVNTVFLIAGLLIGSYFFISNANHLPSTLAVDDVQPILPEGSDGILLDLDGDGIDEIVFNEIVEPDEYHSRSILTAYNANSEVVATMPEKHGTIPTIVKLSARRLTSDSTREYLVVDTFAGTHQFETLLFELKGEYLLPLCKTSFPTSFYDCLFYYTTGELIIDDLDDNGRFEVVELVDEYPEPVELDIEEIETIEQEFAELGDGAVAAAIRVAALEGNRGRDVVWGIHTFNGEYFEPVSEEQYEKLYGILYTSNPELLSKSDLKPASIEAVEFIKSFWSGELTR